jgi:hypothetical protein
MGAILAWGTTLAILMAGLIALQRLGLSVGPIVTAIFRGAVHLLGHAL